MYRLRSDPGYGIFTGQVSGLFQIIIGRYRDLVVSIVFDHEGDLIEVREAIYEELPRRSDIGLRESLETDGSSLRRDHMVKIWYSDQDFQEKPIAVKIFSVPGKEIAIQPLPWDLQHFLDHRSEFSDEVSDDYLEMINDWSERGDFVFLWMNDFWCNPDGVIIAS